MPFDALIIRLQYVIELLYACVFVCVCACVCAFVCVLVRVCEGERVLESIGWGWLFPSSKTYLKS